MLFENYNCEVFVNPEATGILLTAHDKLETMLLPNRVPNYNCPYKAKVVISFLTINRQKFYKRKKWPRQIRSGQEKQ